MINLIKAELFKLKRNHTFWVLIGVVTTFYALINYLVIIDWWNMSTGFNDIGLKEFNALETMKTPIVFNLSISTLAGFFINSDYTNGTIKNQVLSGNKRSHIYLSKLIVFSLGVVVISVILPLITAVLETFLLGHSAIYNFSTVNYLIRSFSLYTIITIAYSAIIMFISSLTRESGKTIIITTVMTIVLFIIEKLLVPMNEIVRVIYENSIFYQIYQAFNPVLTVNEITKNIFISIVTLVIMTVCGIMIFKRKEIK